MSLRNRLADGSVREVVMSAKILKRKQVFSFQAPAANCVQLVGDFTHWQSSPVPLHREADGSWKTTVPLSPGTYHYRFLVDGNWQDDPECPLRVSNPYGSEDAVLVVDKFHS